MARLPDGPRRRSHPHNEEVRALLEEGQRQRAQVQRAWAGMIERRRRGEFEQPAPAETEEDLR